MAKDEYSKDCNSPLLHFLCSRNGSMCRRIYYLSILGVLLVIGSASSCSAVTGSYSSTTGGTHAVSLTSGTETYENITVTKTGDATGSSDGESGYDWTGSNAAVFAGGKAQMTITGSGTTITTDALGGNAVFSYGGKLNGSNSGDGTKITISDATITTSKNNSGGLMVTGGGVIEASNLTITTSGGSSAAIRADRGGGTISVTGGTYTTSGSGSPAIYSTAAITGNDVTLESKTAQVVVIEGGNSVTLTDSTLTANHNKLNGQDTMYQAILIYQSMSGDASDGSSKFTMTGGSLTNAKGDIFHVTNTTTAITLSGVTITNNDASGYFLRASSDSWGNKSSNGGKVTLNAEGQNITGNILVDSISTLTMNLKENSSFMGAINTSGNTGTVKVTVDAGSTWTLTANSNISSLTNKGTINQGSYKLYVNGTEYDGAGTDGSDSTGITITTSSLKDATVGKSYTMSLRAESRKSITWTADGLPDGLSLSSAGKLTGKPAAAGTYSVIFTASNNSGSSTKTLSLNVSDVAPKIKVSSKPGTVGEPYSLKFGLSAGTGAIAWTMSGDLPAGLKFDANAAVISGEPSEAWSRNITVTASNSAGKASKTFKLVIKAVKPSISTKTLASGSISTDYEASLDITGTAPVTVSVTGLPDGLTYSADTGKITGTPKANGKYTVKVKAENAAGRISKSYKLVIYAPPSISAVNLSPATAGKSYTTKFSASGTTPLKWTVSSGELPEGMHLNAKTGILKGKPELDGSYDLTVTASNDSGSDSKAVTLSVNAVAPKLSGNLKKGTAGKAYSSSLKVKGTEPIVWSVSGDLPAGITFSDGTFSGTPARYFKGNITVTVTHGTLSDSETYSLEIKAVAPKIKTKTLASGVQWQAYSAVLEATGTPDIKWSWTGNPAGLVLSADTGEISGTPTKAGTYKVKVTAKNDAKSVSKTIRLVIADPSNTASKDVEGKSIDEETSEELAEYYGSTEELPEGFVIAAELGMLSVDESGQYDFAVTLSESAPTGAKLFWVANSERPSDDDAIADFFDVNGQDINAVPANHEVNVSAWLNKDIIYRPVIAVKK